jgi:hypothetical protein
MTIEYIACVAASLEEVVAYTRGQVRCCPSTERSDGTRQSSRRPRGRSSNLAPALGKVASTRLRGGEVAPVDLWKRSASASTAPRTDPLPQGA